MSRRSTQIPKKENIVSETEFPFDDSDRFRNLRGVRWRMDLGILPHSSSGSIDDLRRVTANSRRRYAVLRRQLLVDPQVPKDGSHSPDLVIDNPLSQNPDSIWGRFFKNAELERMVDQDLTRLYPERASYFQTSECQGMLRRILLLWCLRHPEYGYRQGMHELLAPLLYVLHADMERLSDLRKVHEDHFSDKFDGFSFHENDLSYKFDFKKYSESEGIPKSSFRVSGLGERDSELQTIVMLTDAYGAEGELGIVISEKFIEHDAYSMFDALMNGAGGGVAMAEFFSPLPFANSQTGLPPVIEASSALYHLLSMVDSSLHSHLVGLGVEPQYFALRWLRVLFGREFSLEDLLLIWDEIFAQENMTERTTDSGFLGSARGAFINAFAVSMILKLRSSLLATENATLCLQRLLNFSEDLSLEKIIEKAKSLQTLAVKANKLNPLILHPGLYDGLNPVNQRTHSLSLDSASPLNVVPESYWEEKWRVLHKEAEAKKGSVDKETLNQRNGWSSRVRVRLSRTESAPTPSKDGQRTGVSSNQSVRRNLLKDLEQQLGFNEDKEDLSCSQHTIHQDTCEDNSSEGDNEQDDNLSKLLSDSLSEVNSAYVSDVSTPLLDNMESETSSVTSNSSIDENDVPSNEFVSCIDCQESSLITDSDSPDVSSKCMQNEDSLEKSVKTMDRKPLSSKFQWLWKFGRNDGEGTSEKKVPHIEPNGVNIRENKVTGSTTTEGCDGPSRAIKEETVDQNLMASLRNIGHSMLENIQVIESFLPQDHRNQLGSLENLAKNGLVGKGQVTAMAALKELRKISNLLSEM